MNKNEENSATPLFVNSYEITEKMLRTWKKPSLKICPVYFWVWYSQTIVAVGVVISWFIFWLIWNNLIILLSALLFTAMVLAKLTAALRDARKEYAYFTKDCENWIASFSFYENNVKQEHNDGVTILPYNQFRYVGECDKCFYIWAKYGRMILYKDKFTTGEPDKFREFFECKANECGGKESLRTKKQHYKHELKGHINAIVASLALVGITLYLISAWIPNVANSPRELVESWGDGYVYIASVPLDDGAAVFFTREAEAGQITATLLSRENGRYDWIVGYSYSIVSTVAYNNRRREPAWFGYDFLTFETQIVAFGIADTFWWDNLPPQIRAEYSTVIFQYEQSGFVLYYRVF